MGVSYSRNKGIKYAHGEYICFIDSDDFLINKHFIENCLKHVRLNRMVYMHWVNSDVNGNIINYLPTRKDRMIRKNKLLYHALYRLDSHILPRNYIISRDVVNKVGLFDNTLNLYEDSDLICKLLKHVKPLMLGEVGSAYRETKNGLSKAKKNLHVLAISRVRNRHSNVYTKLLHFAYATKKSFISKIKILIDGNYHNLDKKVYLSTLDSNEALRKLILDVKPHFIGRFGFCEINGLVWQSRKEKLLFLKYPNNVKKELAFNAGMFSTSFFGRHYFLKTMIKASRNIDYLASLGKNVMNEKIFINKYLNYKNDLLSLDVFDGYLINDFKLPWIKSLEGKKVLVINPNSTLIESQYNLRKTLFDENRCMPSFKLITYSPFITSGLVDKRKFKSWKFCFKKMTSDIKKIDFDIALLGCGSYGLPLANEIYKMGKTSIYVGGCLQLLFGIIGKRWEERAEYSILFNSNWKRPDDSTKAIGWNHIEDSCYW